MGWASWSGSAPDPKLFGRMQEGNGIRRVLLASCLGAALLAPAGGVRAEGGEELAGDYFVGAAVFLFERTVLAAFAPTGISESMLDAGAMVNAIDHATDEDGAVALEAMLGWLRVEPPDPNAGGEAATVPGLDAERRRALICLAFGADPDARAALAHSAGLGKPERADCAARYQDAHKRWAEWLKPYRKTAETEAGDHPILRLSFAPAIDEGDQAIADALKQNGLFQVLTDDFNRAFAFPRPVTALLTQCGEPKAFYNVERGEAVLCYELLAALLRSVPR